MGPQFLVGGIFAIAIGCEPVSQGLGTNFGVVDRMVVCCVEVGAHRLDLLVGGLMVVENKAKKRLEDVHFAVIRSYLRAMGLEHGLLMKSSAPRLQVKPVVATAGH